MSATTAGGRRGKGKQRGTQAAGKLTCASCGEGHQAGARFCQSCGRSLIRGSWFDAQTLTVLGAASLTLAALGLLFASVLDTEPTFEDNAAVTAPSRTTSSPSGQPPDLSTMSPREAADRLFNRVMMADEQGDDGEVTQFAPMAVAAYEQLDSLDLDALYHLGLIQAAAGNAEGAQDAAQRMKATVPGHLLASLLEHRLAMDDNDQEKAARAIERFKASYDEEIKINRLEYRDHQLSIDQFREQLDAAASN